MLRACICAEVRVTHLLLTPIASKGFKIVSIMSKIKTLGTSHIKGNT